MLDIPALFLVALIQGITEFLPVSSSGHLVLLPQLTDFQDQGQTIDVAAHIGTLGAVMVYLRHDLQAMLTSLFAPAALTAQHPTPHINASCYRHLIGLLVIASLPVIIAGLALELAGPDMLRAALVVALANLVFAVWLWRADSGDIVHNLSPNNLSPDNSAGDMGASPDWQKMSFRHGFYIGCAQILALIPGASRSGVTMTMARQLGYDRLTAARFSLLLSIPAIAGAGLLKGLSLAAAHHPIDLASIAVVAGLSFVFALLAIRWMMGWLARADFRIFVIYRIGLGIILLALIIPAML